MARPPVVVDANVIVKGTVALVDDDELVEDLGAVVRDLRRRLGQAEARLANLPETPRP